MIVPMTKYSILVFHRDFPQFMRRLQEEGLLDIRQEEVYAPKSDKEFYPVLERYEKVLQALKGIRKSIGKEERGKVPGLHPELEKLDDAGLLARTESLLSEEKELQARIEELQARLAEASLWGDFDAGEVQALQEEGGIVLVLATASQKKFPGSDAQAQSEFPVQVVRRENGRVYFIYACPAEEAARMDSAALSEKMGMSVDICAFPKQPCSELERQLRRARAEMDEIREKLHSVALFPVRLEACKTALFDRFTYKTVSMNVPEQAEGSLRMVQGFLPSESASAFDAFLEKEEVVYRSSPAKELPPEESGNIPVLLRNNRFARIFEPITLLFSLPNYREIDLTPMLAPFFMAFFGFCLGDAGYGLLLIAVGLLLVRKLPAGSRGYAWLAFWFGIATVVFGTLSGTFFGISLFEVEFLGDLRRFMFNSDKMMILSLALGGVQILFGMVMNVLRITKEEGFRFALHKVGWLMVIAGGGLSVGLPLLGRALPPGVSWLLYGVAGIGALLALFYNHPRKNPLFNLGLGLWDTYNMATGLVGDLLSYIRLFALGLTGGILGSVFNTLALDASAGIGVPVLSQLVLLFILVFGHGLNIALCILGAVVHPLRLTFVEFYKNAGFEGGGKAYRPFAMQGKA